MSQFAKSGRLNTNGFSIKPKAQFMSNMAPHGVNAKRVSPQNILAAPKLDKIPFLHQVLKTKSLRQVDTSAALGEKISEITSSLNNSAASQSRLELLNESFATSNPTEIDSTTLSKRISAKVTDSVSKLFPGSGEVLPKIKDSIKASISWMIPENGFSKTTLIGSIAAVSTLFLFGEGTAFAATSAISSVLDNPLPYILGGLAAVGVAARYAKTAVKNPHSTLKKVFHVAEKSLPFTATGLLLYGSHLTLGVSFDFNSLFQYVSWKVPLGLAAALSGIAVYKMKRDIKAAKSSQEGSLKPYPDKFLKKTIVASHLTIATELHYLTYRTLMYAAIVGYTGGLILGIPQGLPLLLASVPLGMGLKRVGRELAEKTYQKFKENSPIFAQLSYDVMNSVLKYIPFLGLTLTLDSSLFWHYATLYIGGWALFADYHSSVHGMGSALENIRALFNPADPLISDAFKGKLEGRIARLVAYVKDEDRNFSKILNVLLTSYPNMEHNLCGELNPYQDIDSLKQIKAAEEVHDLIRNWQAEIYNKFKTEYMKTPANLKEGYLNLAKVFEELGRLYSGDDPDCFISRLKKLVSTEKENFKLAGEQAFVRQAYDALRIKGDIFYEMRALLREKAEAGALSEEELKAIYKQFLGIYSVRLNYVLRRQYLSDERISTKTWNLAFPQTHNGEFLYDVWMVDARRTLAEPEAIPSLLVRIDNPNWNHIDEGKRFIWVEREGLASVLGLSQSASNKIEFVDNIPEGREFEKIPLNIKGKVVALKGFYSSEEVLKPGRLIWREGLEGKLKDKIIWVEGQPEPEGFRENFINWGIKDYGKEFKDFAEECRQKGKFPWVKDKPGFVSFMPADLFLVSDEAYIDLSSPIDHQAEIAYTEQKDRVLRLIGYKSWTAEFYIANLEKERRNPKHIKNIRYQDAYMGLQYRFNGKKFNIPLGSRETVISSLIKDEGWKRISYGEVSKERDSIVVCDKDGEKLGEIAYPIHMHPQIDGDKLEFDVFPTVVGARTWLEIDYGENFGVEPYDRYRFVLLEPEKEAKQMLWPNYATDIKFERDIKFKKNRLVISGLSPTRTEIYPFESKWYKDLREERELPKVTAVESGKEIWVVKQPDGSFDWSFKKEEGR